MDDSRDNSHNALCSTHAASRTIILGESLKHSGDSSDVDSSVVEVEDDSGGCSPTHFVLAFTNLSSPSPPCSSAANPIRLPTPSPQAVPRLSWIRSSAVIPLRGEDKEEKENPIHRSSTLSLSIVLSSSGFLVLSRAQPERSIAVRIVEGWSCSSVVAVEQHLLSQRRNSAAPPLSAKCTAASLLRRRQQ